MKLIPCLATLCLLPVMLCAQDLTSSTPEAEPVVQQPAPANVWSTGVQNDQVATSEVVTSQDSRQIYLADFESGATQQMLGALCPGAEFFWQPSVQAQVMRHSS